MCRWLAYTGVPVYLETMLYEPENSLIEQSLHAREGKTAVNADGFGIGWYTERSTPGVYREVLPAWSDSNLRNLSAHIESGMFLAHVRAATHAETSRVNCHPFTHERWLFMHNGQIGNYAHIRWKLDRLIPEHLYPIRHGATDSELLFCLLFANGLEEHPEEALRKTLAQVIEVMEASETQEPFRLTAALSNGETLYAVRFSTDDKPPSLYWQQGEQHVMVSSEPLEVETPNRSCCWEPVSSNQLLTVHQGTVTHQQFSPSL